MTSKILSLLILLSLAGCAAREKAPDHAGESSAAKTQQTCCLVRVENQLDTAVELDYLAFSVTREGTLHQQNTTQTAGFSFKNQKVQPGAQEQVRINPGNKLKIRFRLPGQSTLTEQELEIQDFLIIRLSAEGLKTQPLPEAERPMISF